MPEEAALTQEQAEILRQMTPEERLGVAGLLYGTARELKAAGLRAQHPDWAEAQVQDEVRRIFARAHT